MVWFALGRWKEEARGRDQQSVLTFHNVLGVKQSFKNKIYVLLCQFFSFGMKFK